METPLQKFLDPHLFKVARTPQSRVAVATTLNGAARLINTRNASFSTIFNSLHSSANQQLFKKLPCN